MHIKEEGESNFKGGLMFNNRQDFKLVNPKKTRNKQERKQTFVLLINLISSVQKVSRFFFPSLSCRLRKYVVYSLKAHVLPQTNCILKNRLSFLSLVSCVMFEARKKERQTRKKNQREKKGVVISLWSLTRKNQRFRARKAAVAVE